MLTTPLQLALVAATIGADGLRPHPHAAQGRGPAPRPRDDASRSRRTIKSYMRTVVTDGTGGAAAVPGVKVAGKTGTAELRTTVREEPPPEVTDPEQPPPEEDPTDTDAWFAAFAPLDEPRDRGRGAARRPGRGRRHRRARSGKVLKAAL